MHKFQLGDAVWIDVCKTAGIIIVIQPVSKYSKLHYRVRFNNFAPNEVGSKEWNFLEKDLKLIEPKYIKDSLYV